MTRKFLNILAYLDNGLSWFVLVFPRPPTRLLRVWIWFQIHQVQLVPPSLSCPIAFLVLLNCLYLHFLWISLCCPPGSFSPLIGRLSFFVFTITISGRLVDIMWSVCISKSPRNWCVSFCRTNSALSIYHLLVWSNFNLLHNSKYITFQSSLV